MLVTIYVVIGIFVCFVARESELRLLFGFLKLNNLMKIITDLKTYSCFCKKPIYIYFAHFADLYIFK